MTKSVFLLIFDDQPFSMQMIFWFSSYVLYGSFLRYISFDLKKSLLEGHEITYNIDFGVNWLRPVRTLSQRSGKPPQGWSHNKIPRTYISEAPNQPPLSREEIIFFPSALPPTILAFVVLIIVYFLSFSFQITNSIPARWLTSAVLTQLSTGNHCRPSSTTVWAWTVIKCH